MQLSSRYVDRSQRDPLTAPRQDISTGKNPWSTRGDQVVRLPGCPVSIAEQILALVHLGGANNPYLDPKASLMRHVLVDRARANRRAKRGGGAVRITLTGLPEAASWDWSQLLDLDQAFAKLEAQDARKARLCECHF